MIQLPDTKELSNELPYPQDRLTRGITISQGLDRLKFGFYVLFDSDRLFDVLTDAKLESQQIKQPVPIQLGPDNDYFYNVHATGKSGGYAFRISRADVNIFIASRQKAGDTPNVWIDIGSASCWSPCYNTVIEKVSKLIRLYGGKIYKNSITEVHLCADFIGLDISCLGIEDKEKWIRRANKFHTYSDSCRFTGISLDQTEGDLGLDIETGITIGIGDIALRIYDKIFEIERNNSKQSLFASVWGKEEYNESPVTRVEFQLRKKVLKQFRIKTLEELFKHMSALWNYCTHDWARYCTNIFDRKNRHQDRAETHEWWLQVQQLTWGSKTIIVRKKPLPQKDMKMLADMMVGCAMNIAAIKRCKFDDTDQITNVLMAVVDTWCRKKAENVNSKTGRNELQEKMKQKINEVWPYGDAEVHGPNAIDAEYGFLTGENEIQYIDGSQNCSN